MYILYFLTGMNSAVAPHGGTRDNKRPH